MSQQANNEQEQLAELAEKIGDYCHAEYLGCHLENSIWHYSYKHEVINMVSMFFASEEGKRAVIELFTPRHQAEQEKKELNRKYEAMFQRLINALGYEEARAYRDAIEFATHKPITIQDVVQGTPAGQEAVQRAMEASAEAMEKARATHKPEEPKQ